ncbi:MAG: hypothetical protein P1P83_06665 [Bacteroidales bacterium]|nr:hypothetical protein [Bacteroidales bacterium]MDT8374806.1 hypothetical protein [Bacteroidales bacterium]
MKTKSILTILGPAVIMLTLLGCGKKKNPATNETMEVTEASVPDAGSKGKPLGVRSGIIEYSYSGDKTGKSTQYFDDYGVKSAVYAEIVQQGEESKGWSLTLGEDQYMWDMNSSQGMKTKNPMVKQMMELSGGDILEYMAGMYEQMGMTKSGTEMFQGKQCTVFKGDMGKVLIWNGLMMMMEMKIGDMVSRQEVTSIKTNVPVDGKYFRIPEDLTFNEIPGF